MRIQWVDKIKGIATVCVVLGHILSGYYRSGLFTDSLTKFICDSLYLFHVPLFFIISGFVFSKAYISWDCQSGPKIKYDKVKGQIINCVAVYFIWSVIFGVFKLIFSGYTVNPITVRDILLIPVNAINPYWYLYILIVCYLICGLIVSSNKYILFVIGTVVLSIVQYWIAQCLPDITLTKIVPYLGFFVIGTVIQKKEKVCEEKNRVYYGIILLVIGMILGTTIILHNFTWDLVACAYVPVWGSICAYLVSLGIISIIHLLSYGRERSEKRIDILQLVGKNSLEIYVMHEFFNPALRAGFRKCGMDNAVICIIINLLISISCCIMISMFLKHIKVHALFFKPYSFICNKKEKTLC